MPTYRFNNHVLFTDSRRLTQSGREVVVGVRVFDVIAYLVEHRQRVVGRDELIAAVWGRVDGADALLAQAVLKARRAFDDDGHAQHHIRTVPRVGYQWVAETEAVDPAAPPDRHDDAAGVARDGVASTAAVDVHPCEPSPRVSTSATPVATAPGAPGAAKRGWHWRSRGGLLALALLLLGLVAMAILSRHGSKPVPVPATDSAAIASGSVAGLILVTPTRVRSRVADDGWMRLGVMSLIAQALGGLPGHAVVPDATALAAAAQAKTDVDKLRASTGATLLIDSDADHAGDDWVLDATLRRADGSVQVVSARATDPVVAATALARNLRDLLSPSGASIEREPLPPDVLALTTRMRAAILEGQNGRALTLVAQAASASASAPEVVLLHAQALQQLGHPGEAASLLHTLVETAVAGRTPAWLPQASTLLGDGELAQGGPAAAEIHFRHSLDLLGAHGDRRSSGLAWRGLGIAQAMRNDLDDAEASYLHARLELEPIGDRLLLARITDGLAYVVASRGHMAAALLLYQQAATMGVAFGANETELGSRLNVAASHGYLLQHALALKQLRDLLPRIRAIDYPALKNFGLAMYASALAETGSFSAARQQLAQLDEARQSQVEQDAVVDVRIDEARVRLAIGDVRGAIAQGEAIRASLGQRSKADLRLEVAALLMRAQLAAGDRTAAAALAADAGLWSDGIALPTTRALALAARAQWQAFSGDAAGAAQTYARALALARDTSIPVILRDVAVPYGEFLIARGDVEGARATAAVLSPYAEDDFPIALLLARVAAASRSASVARAYFAQAHGLAGERWTADLAREEAVAIGQAGTGDGAQ